METLIDRLEELEEDLASRAFLYDAPRAYQEGVEATIEAVRAMLARARGVA